MSESAPNGPPKNHQLPIFLPLQGPRERAQGRQTARAGTRRSTRHGREMWQDTFGINSLRRRGIVGRVPALPVASCGFQMRYD